MEQILIISLSVDLVKEASIFLSFTEHSKRNRYIDYLSELVFTNVLQVP